MDINDQTKFLLKESDANCKSDIVQYSDSKFN